MERYLLLYNQFCDNFALISFTRTFFIDHGRINHHIQHYKVCYIYRCEAYHLQKWFLAELQSEGQF